MCEGLGLSRVRTYVASGNVTFEASRAPTEAGLSEAIARTFGHDDVPVLVRDAATLRAIHEGNPFDGPGADPKKVYVGFLAARPTKAAVAKLLARDDPDAAIAAGEGAVYARYDDGLGRSKLTHAVIERLLGVDVTMRNLNTVRTLVEMTE